MQCKQFTLRAQNRSGGKDADNKNMALLCTSFYCFFCEMQNLLTLAQHFFFRQNIMVPWFITLVFQIFVKIALSQSCDKEVCDEPATKLKKCKVFDHSKFLDEDSPSILLGKILMYKTFFPSKNLTKYLKKMFKQLFYFMWLSFSVKKSVCKLKSIIQ